MSPYVLHKAKLNRDPPGGWGMPLGSKWSQTWCEISRTQHSTGTRAWQVRSENHQCLTNKKTELTQKILSYRRVRAQEAIGEIEKERILLKQKLDIRNSDYEQKAQVWYQIVLLIFKPVVLRWLFKNMNNYELKIWFDMFEFDDLDLGVWRGETWVRLQACQDGHRGLLTRGLSWSWPQCWSLGIQNWHISVAVTINWIIVYLPSSCCLFFHKFSCRWRSWRQRWRRWRRRRTRGSRNCRYAKIKILDICL